MSTIWQIAAGERGRYYSDLFLRYDVMFMGPGSYGPFIGNRKKYKEAGSLKKVRCFCEDVRPGDFVLLREGYQVISLGLITDDEYFWDDRLDDVYAWDLQHCRRVTWQNHLQPYLARIQSEKVDLFHNRKQIPTFTRVEDSAVLDSIRHLLSDVKERKVKDLFPDIPLPLTSDQIRDELFNRGFAFEALGQVISVLEHLSKIGSWYGENWETSGRPSEHEIVAHMILPLFHTLGWSEQLLAIEWRKIDLAAFSGAPTNAEKCVLVCEAKSLWSGLQNVWGQAVNYVQQHELIGCKKILITDGLRYFLYQHKGDDWKQSPDGYLNIRAIRTKHLIPANTNGIDTILALTPAGVARPIGC